MGRTDKLRINNFRFDEESCGPSQYWQGCHFEKDKSTFKFPFTGDDIIRHVSQTIARENIIYNDEMVRGIYMFGSRVSRTNVNDSDFDFLMIIDDFYSHCISKETRYSNNLQYLLQTSMVCGDDGQHVYELEIHLMETSFFMEHVYSQLPIFMLSVLQPNPSFVLLEDDRMKLWRHHWSLWFLRISRTKNSFLHELNYCFNKAFRFWNVLEKKLYKSESERKATLKKVKKNLAHGIRYCKFAYQMVNAGAIYNYSETNKLYDSIVFNTDSFSTWEEYKQISEDLYKVWKEQMKQDLKDVNKDALLKIQQLKNNESLTIVNFLNTYSSGFEMDNPLFSEKLNIEHNYELDYSHHYKYGPYSLMRLLAVNVSPVLRSASERENPNTSKLFKIDLDMDYMTLELCKVFLESTTYLECNGTVLSYETDENGNIVYYPVCIPRFYSMDYGFILEKIGSSYFSDIDMNAIQVLEKPVGMKCSLFYYSGEWRFVFENEKDNWISKWVLKNFDTGKTESGFKNLFTELGMQYPAPEDQNFNFFFVYQEDSKRIIFCGCRNLQTILECENWCEYSKKYGWNDRVKSVPNRSFMELLEYVNDFNQFSPLEFEGLDFVNYKQSKKCFSMKSSIHANTPYLRICNANYLISKLDQHILENPPEELTSSKYNDTRIAVCVIHSIFSDQINDENLIKKLNPLFSKSFREFKENYLEFCGSINAFYNDQLISIEEDHKQFNATAKKYLRGNLVGLFHNLKKFRRDSQLSQVDAAQYWRVVSFTNRMINSQTSNGINLQEVKQVLELTSIFKSQNTNYNFKSTNDV